MVLLIELLALNFPYQGLSSFTEVVNVESSIATTTVEDVRSLHDLQLLASIHEQTAYPIFRLRDKPSESNHVFTYSRKDGRQRMPVLMPGDAVPKFIALPCPCRPPKEDKLATAAVHGSPPHKFSTIVAIIAR
ncbi:hypothetical protein SAY86_027186 [Trapa natans]|uniref:Uncharacterized protein n=1 Tax=Trapa natans TaxID=22666 RepID=A0AAN7QIY7_TRANT|nr:hypothetical protein SAY86_027186 [Trapa natans]